VQAVLQAFRPESGISCGIQPGPCSAVCHIDLIHIVHELQRLGLSDIFMQRAAEFVGNIVFAVGKRACSAETVHDSAGGAVDALGDLFAVNGAFSFMKGTALFENGDLQAGLFQTKLISREDTAGAGADNNYVVFFHVDSLLYQNNSIS